MCLGIPARITAITDPARCLAQVDIGGVKREINVACIVSDAQPIATCIGEWVLIHVGFALARIDAEQAAATLALLQEIGELEQERT